MHSADYAVVRYPSVCPYDYARWCINNSLKLFYLLRTILLQNNMANFKRGSP